MAVTLKYKIIELLSRDVATLHSISDIAKKLGVAYSHAHSFVITLVKEGVIDVQKIGNVSVCRLNLKSAMSRSYLSIIESRRALEWIRKNPQAAKITEKIEQVKDNIHTVLIKGNRTILIVPEKISGVDFSMFRNRAVMNMEHLKKNKHYYTDCIILHGAEKFWGSIE
ncbi:MAG: helix-turn-helix domain-containing protein [Candidatus Woesearchaeota archaeon]